MADSIQVFPAGFRVLDTSGNPVSGAKIKFFDAGTSTPQTIYSDKDVSVALGSPAGTVHCDTGGHPVTAFGGSTKTLVYVKVAPYKIQITTSADVDVVAPIDQVRGALDTSPFTATSALPKTPVTAKSSAFTAVSADRGKIFNCDPSGGTFTATIDSAITLGDNWNCVIRHDGTANQIRIVSTGAQVIRFPNGVTHTAFSLTARGESVGIASSGAELVVYSYCPPLMRGATGIITIADRLSTPPGSPVAGARYIVTAAPTGAWSTFAEHDIAEADGQGGWFKNTPPVNGGWLAYVQDEGIYYKFVGTAWTVLLNAASDTAAGIQENAVQSEMEAASSTTLNVTPGRTHFHPGVAKAWAKIAGDGTSIAADYGVASITDNGVGDLTITFDTAFSATTSMVPWASFEALQPRRQIEVIKS